MLPNPEIDKLIQMATDTLQLYKDKSDLSVDEEIQFLAAAYSVLFLKTVDHHSMSDLAEAHRALNQCYQKLGEPNFAKKHKLMEDAYKKM